VALLLFILVEGFDAPRSRRVGSSYKDGVVRSGMLIEKWILSGNGKEGDKYMVSGPLLPGDLDRRGGILNSMKIPKKQRAPFHA
jgi:hypothetical protein